MSRVATGNGGHLLKGKGNSMDMIKMKAPEDNKSGAGFDGEFYGVDGNGVVEVPVEARTELLSHGFTDAVIELTEEQLLALAKKAKLTELGNAIKQARTALKADKENPDLKAAVEAAVKDLEDFKAPEA